MPRNNLAEALLERAAIMEHDSGMTRADADKAAWLDIVGSNMGYPINTVLFACLYAESDLAEVIDLAQAYIAENKLTDDDVKLVKRSGMILVISKKPVFEPKQEKMPDDDIPF